LKPFVWPNDRLEESVRAKAPNAIGILDFIFIRAEFFKKLM